MFREHVSSQLEVRLFCVEFLFQLKEKYTDVLSDELFWSDERGAVSLQGRSFTSVLSFHCGVFEYCDTHV